MSNGFTIVELLLVIVVISILAVVSIVSYNGLSSGAAISGSLNFEAQLHHRYSAFAKGDWSFDECSGSSVASSTYTTPDAITGSASWITDTPSGKGCALRFSGAESIDTKASLGSTFYVKAAWVRIMPQSCADWNILSQSVTEGATSAFFVTSCKLSAGQDGSWYIVSSPNTINDGKWHYVALIWENGTMKLYLDGKLVSSADSSAPSSVGYLSIGSHYGMSFMVGDIDNPFTASE